MPDLTIAAFYPTGPLSANSTAAVARLVSQVTSWLGRTYPGQVTAVCMGESNLHGVKICDLSLPRTKKILNGLRNRLTFVTRESVLDEVTSRTHRGVEEMLKHGMEPRVIVTATAPAAVLCRQHFPNAGIILWVHAAPVHGTERWAERAFRAADALVVPSRALYQLLWDRFAFQEFTPPVWIIENYADLNDFYVPTQEQRREARRKLQLRDDEFAIAHVSRGPVKGLQILEAALPLVGLNGRRLTVLSAGDKGGGSVQLTEKHAIKRLGRIPIHDLRTLYHAADLGAIPSVWFETFSLAAVEMMACGLCVLASRSGGLCEVITDGRTGRIVPRPNDVELWASMLQEMITDETLRRDLARQGRLEVGSRFSGTVFYAHWKRLIDSFLSHPSQVPLILDTRTSLIGRDQCKPQTVKA